MITRHAVAPTASSYACFPLVSSISSLCRL